MPRVIVCETVGAPDPSVHSLLEADGFEIVWCADGEALLEQAMHGLGDVVIYALSQDCHEDLGVLRLLRRAAPEVPLVLLAAEDSLRTRKLVQGLRPIYYAVAPVDVAELRDVVRDATSRRRRVMP